MESVSSESCFESLQQRGDFMRWQWFGIVFRDVVFDE
jgi:hypothetical protein